MSDEKIVKFLMPDGSEVSNDPRWHAEQAAKAQEELLASTPNTGHAGIPDEEMAAQIGGGLAPLQSGQPGVGENATIENPDTAYDTTGGRLLQRDDRKAADEAGVNPATDGVEVEDSNEKVLDRREEVEQAQQDAADAAAELAAQEDGDTDKPLSEWSPAALKAEVKRVNAERVAAGEEPLDTKGVRKKSELVSLLESARS
jgi:hypothetical protein